MKRFYQLAGIFLMVCGAVPIVVWLGYAIYMLYLGPRTGWLSDRFMNIEGQSFIWCAGMFTGIGAMASGDELRKRGEKTRLPGETADQ
jgi:hypothetical protein